MNIGVIGQEGETRVAKFLQKQGFSIIKRNYQCRFGEIDIIAENNELIIFVEVKTRKENSLLKPIEAVDARKVERIRLTASDYLSKTECDKQPRFDIAEVTVFKTQTNETKFKLNYIENAF